jgi:2-methylcitrate dehydratase
VTADWITSVLCSYALECSTDMSTPVRRATEQRVLDSVACAIAGSTEAVWQRSARYAASRPALEGGPRIWFSSLRAEPATAALVNGVAVRCLDLNDAYLGAENLHPSDFIPAVIAVAESNESVVHSGSDVLLATAIGYEVGLALCDTLRLRDNGFDHVIITGVAACCAVGRLLGLTKDQLANAISMFVVANSALRQTRAGHLTMWKSVAGPDAVREALFYCGYARAGVEGPAECFTGERGLINQLPLGGPPSGAALDRLAAGSAPARVGESHLKLRGFAYAGHSAVDAASLVHAQLGDSVVTDVVVDTFKVAVDIMGQSEAWEPHTRETADHSLPYMVYEMLRHGEVGAAAFRPERYADPAVHRFLADHVRVRADPGFTARFPAELPARVAVTTADGRQITETVDVPYGHARAPLPWERLVRKLHDLADPVVGERLADEIDEAVQGVSSMRHVGELTRLLAPAR